MFGESLDIAPSSDSAIAFERASHWLKDCAENHSCYNDAQRSFLPSRMLKLEKSETASSVQLVERSAVSASPYAALSYCWGKDTSGVLITTKTNYSSHLKGIPVASLPKTVQDAITVCRRLGIYLLWVDALCIVQDDGEDWRREAEKMIDVYFNSFLTISANEPNSCKLGFFGPQRFGSSEWQRSVPVQVPPGLGGPASHLLFRDTQMERPKLFSLDSRGWCLQESVMPRRRLVFDGCELSWNCMEKMFCECGHLDEEACGIYPLLRTGKHADEENDDEELSTYAKLHLEWMDFVEQYSQRALTKSSDKLIAISGVVRLFETRFANAKSKETEKDKQILGLLRNLVVKGSYMPLGISDGYFSGLWGDCFIPNLTWTVDHTQLEKSGRMEHKKIEESSAPSWSWASIDGPVTFRHMEISIGVWRERMNPELTFDAIVHEVGCKPIVTGKLNGNAIEISFLRISGPLVPVELAVLHPGDAVGAPQYFWYRRMAGQWDGPIPCRRQCFARTPRLQSWRVFVDVERLPTIEKGSPLVDCWSHPRHDDSNGCGCSFNFETEYACLRLMTYKANDGYRTNNVPTIVLFLVLKRVPGSTQSYQRIGLGLWNKDEGVQEAPMNGGDYDMFVEATCEEVMIV